MNSYGNIIQEQLTESIIKMATTETAGSEFYLPRKPFICKSIGSTKVSIVY